MSSKLGVHVTTGSRNGYGLVVGESPAVVVSVNEGGALVEARLRSGGRTITVYRDTSVYGDAPPNIDNMSAAEARASADLWYPHLKARWELNPADYYQPTNELGGDNPTTLRNLAAFETRLMELAEVDGLSLVVGSCAGGSPGSWDLWVEYLVPLIRRAGLIGRHVYGRHAYGGVVSGSSGFLTREDGTPADANAARPFQEAQYLMAQGINTPMLITEAGQHGGFRFAGVDALIRDATRYDALCSQFANIWAFALWTYGVYQSANIESASEALAAYLDLSGGATRPVYPPPGSFPVPQPVPGTGRGTPRTQYARRYICFHESVPVAAAMGYLQHLYLQGKRHTFGWSADDAGIGDLDTRTVELVNWPNMAEMRAWYATYYPGVIVEEVRLGVQSLDVPYLSQWGPTASRSSGDCGPANVAMVARYFGRSSVTVDEAAIACGQPPGSSSTSISQLRAGLSSFGVTADYISGVTAARMRQELDAGRPLIMLLDYQYISDRLDQAYLDNHFFVIKGYDASGFVIHDPDWWGTRTAEGANRYYRDADLMRAIQAAGSQGLTCRRAATAPAPTPGGSARLGLHASADSYLAPGELDIFATARAQAVKVLSSMRPEDVSALRQRLGPGKLWVVRAFLDFGGRSVTPAQFVEWTFSDVARTLQRLEGESVYLELHNEPNLVQEGLGASWANGSAFNAWYLEVLAQYRGRVAFPGLKMTFPGLSPGGDVPGVREDSTRFLGACMGALRASDAAGDHRYWGVTDTLSDALRGVAGLQAQMGAQGVTRPIVITEASNPSEGVSGADKGRQYVDFARGLPSGVEAVTYFVASASHAAFQREVWVTGGRSTGIAEVVGAR